MPRRSKKPTDRVETPASDSGENMWLVVKQLDSQCRTIILLLDQLGKHLDSVEKLIEITVGERLEKLRRDFRNGLAALVAGDDTSGDAQKIVRDFLFNEKKIKG